MPRGPKGRKMWRTSRKVTFYRGKWSDMCSGPINCCAGMIAKSGLGTRQVLFFLGKTDIGTARRSGSQKSTFSYQGSLLVHFGLLLGVPFWAERGLRRGLENRPKTTSEFVRFCETFMRTLGRAGGYPRRRLLDHESIIFRSLFIRKADLDAEAPSFGGSADFLGLRPVPRKSSNQ